MIRLYFIDLQGNQAQTYEVFVSFNNEIRAENIKLNIPTKVTITSKTQPNQLTQSYDN